MIYELDGSQILSCYDCIGSELDTAYDISQNIVFEAEEQEEPYISGRTLLFEDKFEGHALNEDNWIYEIGNCRNNEFQFYRSQNVAVENGNLVITAKRETHLNKEWTSGSITTQTKKNWLYGRFEAKIKFPNILGAFAAFWTVGGNHWAKYASDDSAEPATNGEGSVPWPQCGEIDITETIPGNTSHPPSNLWDNTGASLGYRYYPTAINIGSWHIYAMEWTSDYIAILIDGNEFKRWTFSDYTPEQIAPYKLSQQIILNLAVGRGSDDNVPAASTNEMKMYVDWVRVYAPLT